MQINDSNHQQIKNILKDIEMTNNKIKEYQNELDFLGFIESDNLAYSSFLEDTLEELHHRIDYLMVVGGFKH